MKIETSLPFDECYGCEKCILNVEDVQILYSIDGVIGKIVKAGCKNELHCSIMKEQTGRTLRYAEQ